jgi:hypothetical protein
MKVEMISIADFYTNPDEVRTFAMSQEFGESGNYPGRRTKPFLNDSVKQVIQDNIKPFAGNVTWWGDISSGAFQYTTAYDKSWIHSDGVTNWAGVCYLTPDAPLSAGTGLFRHKETGLEFVPKNPDGSYDRELMKLIYRDSQDMTKWELTDRVANKFNRLVLYRGDLFHMSLDYFGQDKYDGRLFQTFFFNSEY